MESATQMTSTTYSSTTLTITPGPRQTEPPRTQCAKCGEILPGMETPPLLHPR